MPIFGFFGALGVLELIFVGAFFLLLVVGASFDRRGREAPKWYIFGLGFLAITAYYWPNFTLTGIWTGVTSWAFWQPVGTYLLAGLAYSLLEFVLEVRRTARYYKESWTAALSRKAEIKQRDPDTGDILRGAVSQSTRGLIGDPIMKVMTAREVIANREDPSNTTIAREIIDGFITNQCRRYGFVNLTCGAAGTPEPLIDKLALAESIGAWTFFWPAYAVSLVIGDLLTEVFNVIAEFLVKISGRFVRFSFADVFKLS